MPHHHRPARLQAVSSRIRQVPAGAAVSAGEALPAAALGPPGRTGVAAQQAAPSPRGGLGMVTAETAAVLPVLLLLTLALAWLVALGVFQVRCLDAAREAARVAARGDGASAAQEVAVAVAPSGANVSVDAGDGVVEAVVSVRVTPPVPVLGGSLGTTLTATATAAEESADVAG